MAENGAGSGMHENVELADFGKILFASMALLGLVALLWAFGAALSPAVPPGSTMSPTMPRPVAHMLHNLR